MSAAAISPEDVTAAVGVLGALVALIALIQALMEYRQQGRQKRAEHFFELRRRLKENEEFARIAALIDQTYAEEDLARKARRELENLPFQVKRDYLGLFEEIAIAMNSKLIKPEVAHYMFGYYALLCWESEEFWTDVNRLSHYWSLFADFCEQMKAQRERFEYRREDFQF